jgi:hypothetical protein
MKRVPAVRDGILRPPQYSSDRKGDEARSFPSLRAVRNGLGAGRFTSLDREVIGFA